MSNLGVLSHHYLETQPKGAARVFEQLQSEDVAAYLNEAPARLAAPVVAAMVPWAAAQCLSATEAESAAATLRQMPHQDATSILRLIQPSQRALILTGLSERQARRFTRSLRFPPNTVGAWMNQGVPTLVATNKVSQALELAAQSQGIVGSHIFLTDETKKLIGAVPIADLLYRDRSIHLQQIMTRGVHGVSSRAALRSLISIAAWDEFTALPIVGRKGNFLGVLTRESLRRGVVEENAQPDISSITGSLTTELFRALLITSSGLLQLVSPQDDREVKRDR